MPVPSVITDLVPVINDNSPAGTDVIGTNMDNYIRAHAAFISQLYTSQTDHASTSASAHVSTAIDFTATGTGAATRTVGARLKDFVNVLDFDGADLGARLQAAYDARLATVMAGDGLGSGMFILIPPNPTGDWWELTTSVDFSSGGYIHIQGWGCPYIRLAANLSYMFRFGVTNKANRVRLDNLEFSTGSHTCANAIVIGGGTRYHVSNIGFHISGGSNTFTDGILIDRSLDPTVAGVSFSVFENIYDTGGTACSNSMIKCNGLVSSIIRHVRPGPATTYGVDITSAAGDVQSNIIEGVHCEPGVGANTALVRLTATTNPITLNVIRALSGNNLANYGIQCAGAAPIESNVFDIEPIGYATASIDNGGVAGRNLNLIHEEATFTPTWSASSVNPSLGNGTLVGKYVRNGNVVTVTYNLVAGSTTTFGTGQYTLTLPTHLPSGATYVWNGSARAYDQSAGSPFIVGNAVINAASSVVTAEFSSDYWGPASPMTWVATDQMAITVTYSL